MKKKAVKLLLLLIIAAAGIVFCCSQAERSEKLVVYTENESGSKEDETDFYQDREESSPTGIWVYVCGCVQNPGVYFLENGARIFEAIELAGGLSENAASEYLNMASLAEDGQQIYVPAQEDVIEQGLSGPDQDADGRININTATLEELMTLPGIGQAKAAAIIAYREQNTFMTIEDIMNVSGIKESSFQKIKEYIKV